MKRHLSRAAAIAVAATVTVLTTGSPASALPAPATTTDPAAAAAGWLAQQFVDSSSKPSPSGDHFVFPGTTYYFGGLTADAVFGLAAAKAGAAKIAAALEFMADNVAVDANLLDTSGAPGPYDGSVAKAALAAIVGGGNPTDFGGNNLLQALKNDECAAVSGPTDPNDWTTPLCPAVGAARNIYSSVSESLVILAEARGSKAYGDQYAPSAAAVEYFLSLQCPDGGFTGATTPAATCTSSVDETGYAAAALAALGDHDAALAKANAWLISNRSAAGYWQAQGGPSVEATGLAVAALEATGDDVGPSRAWLASQQVTSGPTVGAGASRGALMAQGAFDPDASIKATADGLLGLASGGSLATLTAAGAAPGTAVLALTSTAEAPSVPQGGGQTVTAAGFAAGEPVLAELHSTPVSLGTVTAGSDGTATISFTVPVEVAPGPHEVVLTGAVSGLSAAVGFTVAEAVSEGLPPLTPPDTDDEAAVGAVVTTRGGGTHSVASADSGPQIAATGQDGRRVLQDALLGVALIVGGTGFLFAGRRRRA